MSMNALYQKYRPQTFDEVVGQKYIIQTIKNAINNDKIAHAYLFTGPRGTGKTTIARLIAKGLNCENSNKPCGTCEHCKSIANGTFPDVVEIDAASNNGVDEVRSLIEKVKYAPLEGKYKVYIIDEVHMMTSGAFNALLKTLEEPPAHVVFILATTEVQKVLPTIISRCQRFDFGKVSEEDLTTKIKEVLVKENVSFDQDVPSFVASLSDGGVRDALGILDQVIAYAGNNITSKNVRDIYGVLSNDEIISFLKQIYKHDIIKCMESLSNSDQKGVDLIRLTSMIIDILKDNVVYRKTNNISILKKLSSQQANEISSFLTSEQSLEYIDILIEASLNYRNVSSVKSYFELIMIKLCNVKESVDLVFPVQTNSDETIETIDENKAEESISEIDESENVPNFSEEIELETLNAIEETPKVISEELVIEPVAKEVIREEKESEPFVLENYKLKDEDILRFLSNSNRASKESAINLWQIISRYKTVPNYSDAAKKLQDCTISAAGNNCLIISTEYPYQADDINSYELYFKCADLIKEIFSNDIYFIAVSLDDFKRIELTAKQMMLEGRFNRNQPISYLYDREKINSAMNKEEKDEILEKGLEIFGDILEIK